MAHYAKLAHDDQAFPFFIWSHDGTLLGAVTISNVRRGVAQMATLGYWIGEAHARRGYMAEATRLLLDHAFHDMGLHRVEAACLPTNVASL